MKTNTILTTVTITVVALAGCLGSEPEGIYPATPAATTVKMDFYNRPLPEIPLPNDIATRHDPTSATGRRINASMVATTKFESHTRKLIDELDGWGVIQPISIPFSGPLSIQSIWDGHRKDKNYDLKKDVVYLINIDRKSPDFGKPQHLDVGHGNYPVVLESLDKYWKNGPRDWSISLLFEEADEDTKVKNGKLDPGEDTDGDGELDVPNYLPRELLKSGKLPERTDMKGRADALMTFYERQSNTLILRPMVPLAERTTYAVVVTRRLKDKKGNPVGSPFEYINHTAQNHALAPLASVLPDGLGLDDVAFAFTFTTQSVESQFKAVRDGLYGHGVQQHLATEFPARLSSVLQLKDLNFPKFSGLKNPYIVHKEQFIEMYKLVLPMLDIDAGTEAYRLAIENQQYVDYHVMGSFESPQLFDRRDASGKLLPYNAQSWPQDLHSKKARARSETIYFWMTVPRKAVSSRGKGKPAPVVIISHGYGGDRTDCLALGGVMAKFGMACVAIDGPSHGLVLNKDQTLQAKVAGTANGLYSLLNAAFKGRALDQNHDGQGDSGADFWSAYVFHTRDMVRQFALDYMQLIRVLRTFDGKRTWDVKLALEKNGKATSQPKGDLNGDGVKELAGDFDADGEVDVGGPEARYYMTGGSLGGIMSLAMGGLEPHLTAIAPVAGGAGLGDVGIRSRQGGVPEAFILRVMGPLFAGTLDLSSSDGEMKLETIVPDLNSAREKQLAVIKGVKVGDTMVVENLESKEQGCGIVAADGKVRAAVAADGPVRCSTTSCAKPWQCTGEEVDPADADKKIKYHYYGDRLKVTVYEGHVIVGKDCKLKEGVKPKATVDKFETELLDKDKKKIEDKDGVSSVKFQQLDCKVGKPLMALTDGLGKRRAHPGLRRFSAFAMFVVEPGDPAPYVRHMLEDPMTYPGTKQTTGTHALIITTAGDMNVPASSGVTAGRVAGLIDYLRDDPRFGKSQNQVLLDTYTAEAVDIYKRHLHGKTSSFGKACTKSSECGTGAFCDTTAKACAQSGVHMDVERFSGGQDMWNLDLSALATGQVKYLSSTPNIPQLTPAPLRAGWAGKDRLGGASAAIFPLTNPTGQHGFDGPGQMTDKVRKLCKSNCTVKTGADPCGCKKLSTYDVGSYLYNMIGQYFADEGKKLTSDLCMSRNDCKNWPAAPASREISKIPY